MATQNGVHLSDLHFENTLWQKRCAFYADEIGVYENRLGEIVNRYTSKEVLSNIEHFQNQFIRQREVMDEIKHEAKVHDQALAEFAAEHPVAVDHVRFRDHGKLRERMEGFEKYYAELKNEFQRFSAKWM